MKSSFHKFHGKPAIPNKTTGVIKTESSFMKKKMSILTDLETTAIWIFEKLKILPVTIYTTPYQNRNSPNYPIPQYGSINPTWYNWWPIKSKIGQSILYSMHGCQY